MSTPLITIFVRHAADCKYAGDEFCKRCDCKKHLRWTLDGKQHRRKAGARSWAEAEEAKRRLEAELRGEPVPVATVTLQTALDSFISNKAGQGVSEAVVSRNKRELSRFVAFAEMRGVLAVGSVSLSLLTDYRATWAERYGSSLTRSLVQKRLRGFLLYCVEAGWLGRVPKLSPITADEPPTMPLTPKEYATLLAAIRPVYPNGLGDRLRATIQLMRWSGLAIRDAVTLRRDQLIHDDGIYRIVTSRQKTGTHVSVPIPEAVAKEIMAVGSDETYLLWENTKQGTAVQAGHSASIAIANIFRAAKLASGHMKSHRLRDTFAVELLQKGVPLEEVSKLLGHDSIKTTERHYAKWVKGRQDRLDKLVTGSW